MLGAIVLLLMMRHAIRKQRKAPPSHPRFQATGILISQSKLLLGSFMLDAEDADASVDCPVMKVGTVSRIRSDAATRELSDCEIDVQIVWDPEGVHRLAGLKVKAGSESAELPFSACWHYEAKVARRISDDIADHASVLAAVLSRAESGGLSHARCRVVVCVDPSRGGPAQDGRLAGSLVGGATGGIEGAMVGAVLGSLIQRPSSFPQPIVDSVRAGDLGDSPVGELTSTLIRERGWGAAMTTSFREYDVEIRPSAKPHTTPGRGGDSFRS
ncbi:MAG: hypothetical protein R3B57_08465 [Phycisphaerales bacterium]